MNTTVTNADHKKNIDSFTHYEMAYLFRNAPIGHIYFQRDRPEIGKYFNDRFIKLGGMTSELSKEIGFDDVPD